MNPKALAYYWFFTVLCIVSAIAFPPIAAAIALVTFGAYFIYSLV